MAYTYADYITRINSMVQDNTGKATGYIDECLQRAVETYDNDKPYIGKAKITADGTEGTDWNLLADVALQWKYGTSYIRRIEYPLDQKPQEFMIEDDDYWIVDDGTALDGSNLILRFDACPTEPFIVEYRIPRILADIGGEPQNFPHNSFDFNAITTLTTHYICQALTSAYATQIDTRITADSVNTINTSRKYADLADMYLSAYNSLVFGEEDPQKKIEPSATDISIAVPTAIGGRQLFH